MLRISASWTSGLKIAQNVKNVWKVFDFDTLIELLIQFTLHRTQTRKFHFEAEIELNFEDWAYHLRILEVPRVLGEGEAGVQLAEGDGGHQGVVQLEEDHQPPVLAGPDARAASQNTFCNIQILIESILQHSQNAFKTVCLLLKQITKILKKFSRIESNWTG